MPGRLRLGDIDADGFPDLLFTLSFQDDTTESYLYHNVECSGDPCAGQNKARRLFSTDSSDNEFGSLATFTNQKAQAVLFLDIDEDGRLDILLQKYENDKSNIEVIYNNYVKDTFFIKALMVNSQYSDVVVGASYRFVGTDLND